MSDKGGKGKGKGGKSSLKEATPKGKDDGSAKSKKTRNVQFSSQAAASTKANSGKGGQADGGAKKDKEPLQLKVENELPKGAKYLMDCEAADILQGIQDHMVILSKDPSIKLPVSFDRALQYTQKSTNYTDPESVRQVLQNLKTYGVTDGEICVMANVYPETADEVFALLPSLKASRCSWSTNMRDPALWIFQGLCYGKLEAGLLTFIIPIVLLGHLWMMEYVKLSLLGSWMALFVLFAGRKFTQPIKDDIGDKSVFIFQSLPEDEKKALVKKLEQQEYSQNPI